MNARKLTDKNYQSRCRISGLTSQLLESSRTGTSSDGWQNISELATDLGTVSIWWCYRETPNDLGEAYAVPSRDNADHIEIDTASLKGFDIVELTKTEIAL